MFEKNKWEKIEGFIEGMNKKYRIIKRLQIAERVRKSWWKHKKLG